MLLQDALLNLGDLDIMGPVAAPSAPPSQGRALLEPTCPAAPQAACATTVTATGSTQSPVAAADSEASPSTAVATVDAQTPKYVAWPAAGSPQFSMLGTSPTISAAVASSEQLQHLAACGSAANLEGLSGSSNVLQELAAAAAGPFVPHAMDVAVPPSRSCSCTQLANSATAANPPGAGHIAPINPAVGNVKVWGDAHSASAAAAAAGAQAAAATASTVTGNGQQYTGQLSVQASLGMSMPGTAGCSSPAIDRHSDPGNAVSSSYAVGGGVCAPRATDGYAAYMQPLVQPEVVVIVTNERQKLPAMEQLLALLAAPLPAAAARRPSEMYREVSTFTSKGKQAISLQKVMCQLSVLGLQSSLAGLGLSRPLGSMSEGTVVAPTASQQLQQPHAAALLADLQLLLNYLARNIRCAVDAGRVVIALHVPDAADTALDKPGLVIAATAGSLQEATSVVRSLVDQLALVYD